jgi:hypothetical protein
MMAKVYNAILGDSKKPNNNSQPTAPTSPPIITAATIIMEIPKIQAMWTQHQVQMSTYNHLLGEWNCKNSSWVDVNFQAMGILNQAL